MNDAPLRPEDAPPSMYGPGGNPQFFTDPAMDRFVAVLLNVTSELWVQAERIDTLDAVIEARGLTTRDEITAIVRDGDAAREVALKQFVDRVLAPLREPAA